MPSSDFRYLGLSPIEDRVFSGYVTGDSPAKVARDCGLPVSVASAMYVRGCALLAARWGMPRGLVRAEARKMVGLAMLVVSFITAFAGDDVMRARTGRLRIRRDHIERAA